MTWLLALSTFVSLALVLGCGLLALKQRGRTGDAPRKAVRILLSAILPGLFFFDLVLNGSSEWKRQTVLFIPFMMVFTYIIGLPVVLLIELVTWRLRPSRTARWLAAAIVLFLVSFLILPLLISALYDPGSSVQTLPQPDGGTAGASLDAAVWIAVDYFAAVLAAALLWWTYLPPAPARASIASLFE